MSIKGKRSQDRTGQVLSKTHSVRSCTAAMCGLSALTTSFLTNSNGRKRNGVGCMSYIVHAIKTSSLGAIATVLPVDT